MAPFTLPGFTEPLNFVSRAEYKKIRYPGTYCLDKVEYTRPAQGSGRNMFHSGIYVLDLKRRYAGDETKLPELAMLRFMNDTTDKRNWHIDIFDDTVARNWKQEALLQSDFSESMATYCIDELRWRAHDFETTGFIFAYNGDVVKSDTAISYELKARLQRAVGKLEAIASKHKEYHPNSGNKVWNLVHPSLFPLVYGTSRILRDETIGLEDCINAIGIGEVLPVPPDNEASLNETYHAGNWGYCFGLPHFSRKFQWLPCDVQLMAQDHQGEAEGHGGIKCTISSYINNLHPVRHGDLYAVIEDVVAAAVPLWNETLLANEDNSRPPRIVDEDLDGIFTGPPNIVDEDLDGLFARDFHSIRQRLTKVGRFQVPEATCLKPTKHLPFVERFAESGLQVIVKLATIELTPEKPVYDGGPWRIEGQANEHICASALYYYSVENITESRLGFRQMKNTHWALSSVGESVQVVGSVLCKEGRLVTFPNTLQHSVLPFELADKTKPGHRKILALFLVDPNMHITSTSSVPPQRKDWWSDNLRAGGIYEDLNVDLVEKIENMVDFPLTMEQAEVLRSELMEERKEQEVLNLKNFGRARFSVRGDRET